MISVSERKLSLLLYADDPGAVNYLFPLCGSLLSLGVASRLVVSPMLINYCKDRNIRADVRQPQDSPSNLLNGAAALVLGTSEDKSCWGHKLCCFAKSLKIPTIGVVDMAVNADKRFRGETDSPMHHAPDWLAVPDKFCEFAYMRLGFPRERILLFGHPHYDVIRARLNTSDDINSWRESSFPKAPLDRPLWLFIAEGIDRLDPEQSFRSHDYTLFGRGNTNFRSAICLQELIDVAQNLSPKPWIVLRPHPKNISEEFDQCLDGIDEWAIAGDPIPMLLSADLVIGMTTMLLLEAYLLRRPTLSIVPRIAEREWLATLNGGLTMSVSTKEDLYMSIKKQNYLHKFSIEEEDQILPRGASTKMAKFLYNLISN
jgi:hypothetical protein